MARDEIVEIQLKIKAHFLDESPVTIAKFASHLNKKGMADSRLRTMLKIKEHIFTKPLDDLTVNDMEANLRKFK